MGKFKKIAIVGNANSTFTKGFINYVLSTYNSKITLICETNTLFKDFYISRNVKVIPVREKSKVEKIPFLKTVNYIFQVCKYLKKEKADLVIINYVWSYLAFIYSFLSIHAKTILLYWGSDLFRAKQYELKMAKRSIDLADQIVVLTDEMRNSFLKQYGKKYSNKLSIIDFGVSAFNKIDQLEQQGFKKSELLGDENDKITTITIGYNAREEQQHIRVMQQLNKLSKENKEKIMLLFPLTYPSGKEAYITELEKAVKKIGVSYIFFTKFMNEEEIAKLCLSSDIFIHAQTTDSISTSMIEQLYSGSTVLNGKWLHYSFLDNLGIKYLSFEFQDLPRLIPQLMKTSSSSNVINKDVLKKNCSWDKCKSLWDELLKKM